MGKQFYFYWFQAKTRSRVRRSRRKESISSYDGGIDYACKPEETKIRRQDLSLSKIFTDSSSRRRFCPLSLLQYRRESIARLLPSGSRSKFQELTKKLREKGRNGQKWAKQVRNSGFLTVLSQFSKRDLHEASRRRIRDTVPTSSRWKVAKYSTRCRSMTLNAARTIQNFDEAPSYSL